MISLEDIQVKFDACQEGNEFRIASLLKDMMNGAKMSFDMKEGFNIWYKLNAPEVQLLFNEINPDLEQKGYTTFTIEELRFLYESMESKHRK